MVNGIVIVFIVIFNGNKKNNIEYIILINFFYICWIFRFFLIFNNVVVLFLGI